MHTNMLHRRIEVANEVTWKGFWYETTKTKKSKATKEAQLQTDLLILSAR